MSSILSRKAFDETDEEFVAESFVNEAEADRPPRHTWPDEFPYRLPEGAASVCRGLIPSVVHLLSDQVPKHAMGMSVYDE